MCDTFVATPEFTASGKMIFGKNSDREPNEAQCLVRYPERIPKEDSVHTTFRTIPQAKKTFEVLLSRPFSIWGAEMGSNSKGVTIGNEAVFTRIPISKKNDGLSGMDLLRVALERSENAADARDTILEFLERFGQDACGGYLNRNFFYHNSFLIADAKEAFVLETADRFWAWKRIRGFYSISNGLTLDSDYDGLHSGAIDFSRSKGWLKKGETFSFRGAFSDTFFTSFSKCKIRRGITSEAGEFFGGKLKIQDAMQILRLEGRKAAQELLHPDSAGFPIRNTRFSPADPGMESVCLHANGLLAPNQTTGSFVAELDPNPRHSQFWATGTSIPSISLFLPISLPGKSFSDSKIIQPGATPDSSLWWNHEILYRLCLRNYSEAISVFSAELREVQEKYIQKTELILNGKGKVVSLDSLSEEALEESARLYSKWRLQVRELVTKKSSFFSSSLSPLYKGYWAYWNRKARIKPGVLTSSDLPYEPAYL